MKSTNFRTAFIMSIVIIVIMACGTTSTATEVAATAEPLANGSIPSTGDGESVSTTGADGSTPVAGTGIQHVVIPVGIPADRSSHAGDHDSSTTAEIKQAAGGDRFTFGKFERPFNAETMDVYYPNLDIVDTFVFQDETWIYGTIQMKGRDANNAFPNKYALELDTDLDGKGDWLIIASNPASTEWKVEGVQVYQDANKDVGNVTAVFSDEKATSDGFETIVFDQGSGEDVDSAWVRISPNDPNTIEFSVKRSVLGNPAKYLINMWAGNALIDPSLFDINDKFSHEQAGAADGGLQVYYPIKAVAEIDNSCRMAVGFEPTGQEPGLCEVFIPNIPGSPPQGCTASPTKILACSINPDPSYSCSWNKNSCSCECKYVGPK